MNDTIKAWTSIVFVVLLVVLMVYGFQSWFFPSSAALLLIGIPSLIPGVAIALWASNPLAQPSHASIRKPFFFMGTLLLVVTLLWTVFGMGLPSLVLKMLGPAERVSATISLKQEGTKYCRRKIQLAEYSALLKESLCVTPTVFDRLNQGQVVSTSVRRSWFGVRIFTIEPLANK